MFHTMENLKRANARAGLHFFDRDSCRFFDSRIGGTLYGGPGGEFFVTSERFHDGRGYSAARAYTVRQAMPGGQVETVGEFQAYASGSGAREAAKRYAREGVSEPATV